MQAVPFTLFPGCQEDSLQLTKVLWFLNVTQQRQWRSLPGCLIHGGWHEGSGSHRPQAPTGSPRVSPGNRTGCLESPNLTAPGTGTPCAGLPLSPPPPRWPEPLWGHLPRPQPHPRCQGKLPVASPQRHCGPKYAPFPLNRSQPFPNRSLSSRPPSPSQPRGGGEGGRAGPPPGQLLPSQVNLPRPRPTGLLLTVKQDPAVRLQRPGLNPDTFTSRTTLASFSTLLGISVPLACGSHFPGRSGECTAPTQPAPLPATGLHSPPGPPPPIPPWSLTTGRQRARSEAGDHRRHSDATLPTLQPLPASCPQPSA